MSARGEETGMYRSRGGGPSAGGRHGDNDSPERPSTPKPKPEPKPDKDERKSEEG